MITFTPREIVMANFDAVLAQVKDQGIYADAALLRCLLTIWALPRAGDLVPLLLDIGLLGRN